MNDIIINGSEFNPTEIKYMPPKTTNQGGKMVTILNSRANKGLYLATPLMMTWGVSDFTDESTGKSNERYTMDLVFPNPEYETAETKKFLSALIGLENKIKTDARTYCKEWFNRKELSEEVVNEKWNPMLKYRKDKITKEPDYNSPPVLKIKVPMWKGQWTSEIYDVNQVRIFPNEINPDLTPVDLIQKGANTKCVIQCGGLYFINGKFGITWKLKQAIVKPKTVFNISGRCLISVSEDMKEQFEKAQIPEDILDEIADEQIHGTSSSSSNVNVQDSDNEDELGSSIKPSSVTVSKIEEDESLFEPEPAAVKKVVKKVVKKKA